MLQDEIQDKLVEEVFELKPDVNTTLVQIKANQLLHILENQESVIDKIESIDADKKDEIKQLLKNQVFQEVLKSSNDNNLQSKNDDFAKLANEENTIEALPISNEDMMMIEDKMENSIVDQTVQNEVKEALEIKPKINQHLKNLTILESQTSDHHQMLQKFVQQYVPKPISQADSILEEMNKTQGILKDLQKMNIGKNPEDIQANLELDTLESLALASEDFPTKEKEAEKVRHLDQAKAKFFNDSDPLMIDEAANFLNPKNMSITSIQDEAELLEHLMNKEIVLDQTSNNLTALEKAAIDTKMEENVVQQLLDYEYHTNQTEIDRVKRSEKLEDFVNSLEEEILEKKYEGDNFDTTTSKIDEVPKNETEIINDILAVSKNALNDVLNNPETDQVIEDSDKTEALLDEVEKSDLNEKNKDDILDKIKEESLKKAEIEMEDVLGIPNNDPTLTMRKNVIEEEIQDFFQQVDKEETKIVQNASIETLTKMEELESLEDNSKVEVLNNLNAMATILKSNTSNTSQIQSQQTKEKVGSLFDHLVETQLDIKASNVSSIKEVEDKLETEFVNQVMDIVVSNSSFTSSFKNETEVELKSYMENEFQKLTQLSSSNDEAYKTIEKLGIQERIIQETLQKFPNLIQNQEMKTYLSYLTTQYFSQMLSNATKLESFTNYLNGVKTISNSTEEDYTQVELKAVPIELNFSRLYFGEIQTIPDHLILVLRNPFITLVSMQMKKAALAAKDYGAYIFHTNSWNNFILNGLKAWYAHTRGWLCSNITVSLLHYEDLTENYSQGNIFDIFSLVKPLKLLL